MREHVNSAVGVAYMSRNLTQSSTWAQRMEPATPALMASAQVLKRPAAGDRPAFCEDKPAVHPVCLLLLPRASRSTGEAVMRLAACEAENTISAAATQSHAQRSAALHL